MSRRNQAIPLYDMDRTIHPSEERVGTIPPRCSCGIAHARPKYAEWTKPEPESFWAALAVFGLLVASLVLLAWVLWGYGQGAA